MATTAGANSSQEFQKAQTHSISLRHNEVHANSVSQSTLHTTVAQKANALTRIYFIHAFLLALAISLYTLFAANHPDGVFTAQVIVLMLIYSFPIVLIYRSTHGMNRNFFVLVGILFFLPLLIGVFRNTGGPVKGFTEYLGLLLAYVVVPLGLYLALSIGNRRQVSHLLLILLMILILASVALVFGSYYLLTSGWEPSGLSLFVYLLVAIVLVYFVLVYGIIRTLAKAHQDKFFSDWMLQFDMMWLILIIIPQGFYLLIGKDNQVILPLFVLVAIYLASRLLLFLALRSRFPEERSNKQLLYLRVFARNRDAEILFKAITHQWRFIGPVLGIGGPDIATAYIEPIDFLQFLGFRSIRQFIKTKIEITQSIQDLDNKTDPDGRFRINNFYCNADTWKQTVSELFPQCSTILIDVRHFNPNNKGVLFEIEQMIQSIPLQKILFIYDETTDQKALNRYIDEFATKVPIGSPNLQPENHQLNFFHLPAQQPRYVQALIQHLFAISASTSNNQA